MDKTARLYLKTTTTIPANVVTIANPNFNGNLTGWANAGSSWWYKNGRAYGKEGSTGGLSQTISITGGLTYKIKLYVKRIYNFSELSSGSVTVNLGDASKVITTNGWQEFELTPTAGTTLSIEQSDAFIGYIDTITINQLTYTSDSYEEVDLFDNNSISLTFNRVDIDDITRRSATYSKTISLPGTIKNNKVFNFLDDLNVEDTTKYFNKKIPCYLYYSDFEIVNGTFELERLTKVEQDNLVQYEGVIYSNIKTIANNVGDKLITGNNNSLNDLDFSEYDHDFNIDNITTTWLPSAVNGSGYYYPVINYTNFTSPDLEVEDMRPSLFVKEIVDKIFSGAGFTYTSTFLNTDTFKSLIMPFVGDMKTPPSELSKRACRVGLSSDYVSAKVTSYTGQKTITLPIDDQTSFDFYDGDDSGQYDNFNLVTHKYTVKNKGLYKFNSGFNTKIEFGVDWENVAQGNYYLGAATDPSTGVAYYYPFVRINYSIKRKRGSTIISIKEGHYDFPLTAGFNFISGQAVIQTTDYFYIPVNMTNSAEFLAGDEVYVDMNINNTFAPFKYAVNGADIGGNRIVTYAIATVARANPTNATQAGSFLDAVSESADMIYEGDTVFMNNILPRNIKQIDFLSSIINMFNLTVDEDPNNPTNLIIDTRDNYFSGGTSLDWTQKLDRSQGLDIERIPTLVGKNARFTYSQDTDNYNVGYTKTYENMFGDRFIENPDKTVEDFEIKILFAPTLSDVIQGTQLIVPQMYETNTKNELQPRTFIPRILFKTNISYYSDAWKDNTSGLIKNITLRSSSSGSNNIWFNGFSLPTASHFDNPYSPTLDLNWDIDVYGTFVPTTPPYGNLYNTYWRKWIEQILDTDSKMITAYFKLSESDIFNFKFSDQITIDGQYFIVNKIEDWVPNELTKVELLKLITPTQPVTNEEKATDIDKRVGWDYWKWAVDTKSINEAWTGREGIKRWDEPVVTTNFDRYRQVINYSANTSAISAATTTSDFYSASTNDFGGERNATIIGDGSRGFNTGDDNVIQSPNFNVMGQANTIEGGENVGIFGSRNNVGIASQNVNIIGENNTIEPTIQKTTVIGNDIIANKSNSTYIGGENIFANKPIQEIIHIIQNSGLGSQVLNPFNTLKQVHILCGMDTIDGVRTLKPSVNNIFVVEATENPFYGLL